MAVAVMSNHLHVIVQQGNRPLAALMQPLLRNLALRVQDAHDLDGPVFWRPFAAQPCLDPHHARNAIVYTHLNPVRAGLCDDPREYSWTSHTLYVPQAAAASPVELGPLESVLDPALALPLFAAGHRRSETQLRDDYQAFVQWRLETDGDADDTQQDVEPPEPWRESVWGAALRPLFHPSTRPRVLSDRYDAGPDPGTADLATIAHGTLAAEAPGVSLDAIRGRRGGSRAVRLRHLVIRRLHLAGYRNVEIARFIGLSESAVSYVLCKGWCPGP